MDIKRGKALKNKDYDFLEQLYAADWTYVTPWGSLVHKQEYLDYLRKIDYQKLEYSDYQGSFYGKTVILTLINRARTQSPDGLMDEKLYYTRIYVKRDDQWTFVAQQGTVIKKIT